MIRRILPVTVLFATLAACGSGGGPGGGPRGRGGPGGWGGGGPKSTPATLVEVTTLQPRSIAQTLQTSASVEAEASADLIPQTTGTVVALYKRIGDPVRKGDALALIRNASLDANARRAQAEVRHLKAQVEEMQTLRDKGAVSQRELEDLRYQLITAQTTLAEATANFGDTRLVAPFDGIVAEMNLKVGDTAQGGQVAAKVVDLSVLRIKATLPERDVEAVSVGQPAEVTSAYDREASATATVSRVAPVVDAATGTFTVELDIAGAGSSLRPGQFVTVDIETDRKDDALVVPRKSVIYSAGQPTVFVVTLPEPEEEKDEAEEKEEEKKGFFASLFGGGEKKGGGEGRGPGGKGPDGKGPQGEGKPEGEEAEKQGPVFEARQVTVKLGTTNPGEVELIDGVTEGQQVITVGQANLTDGATIRLTDEALLDAPKEPGAALMPDDSTPAEAAEDTTDDAEGEAQ